MMNFAWYETDDSEKLYSDKEVRQKLSTVKCGECNDNGFLVSFIPAPGTGNYLKLTCLTCGYSHVVYDECDG